MRVVAWTIGAVMSAGATPALPSAPVTPRRTPSRGLAGVVSVLSTTTAPEAASRRTTSVKVPPMSTASRQSATSVVLPRWGEDVQDPRLAGLGIADELAVAVGEVLGRPVDVARLEQLALI